MLLWLLLLIGTALSLVAIAMFVAMVRAERRARRAFYQALGYSDETIAGLNLSKGFAAAQLAQLRQGPAGAARSRTTRARRDASSGADGGD